MMRRMRHRAGIFVAALVTAVTVSACILTAWAASGRIAFSDPSAMVGSQVSVNMKVTSSENLEKVDVMLSYDSNVLEFVSGTNAEGDAGAIRVRGDGGTPNAKTLAFTLKFNARTVGSSKITVTSQEVYDSNSQLVTVNQVGSSTVTVSALETASKDATLQSLQVSPGTLTPQFSPDVDTYAVSVGTDVEKLIVTAKSTDENATNVISGYEDLQMGENRVTCKVTAQDGETTKEYVIVVTKAEGEASAEEAVFASNVKMRISRREITVLDPDDSVNIPEGFVEKVINIDDNNKVRGWVWGEESEPQYCIVYGMNEAGERAFYRYDMKDTERTIQRYFEDPAVEKVYELKAMYDKLYNDYKMLQIFLIAAIVIAVGLLILVLVVVLKKNNGPGGRGKAALRENRGRRGLSGSSLDFLDEDEYEYDEYQGEDEEEYQDDAYEDARQDVVAVNSQDSGNYDRKEHEYQQRYEPEEDGEVPSGGRRKSFQEVPKYREICQEKGPSYPDQEPHEDKSYAMPPESAQRKKAPELEDDGDDFEIFDL